MLVGHSSGIEDLALLLARRGARLAEMREKFPTGALATLEFRGRWSKLGSRDADLTGYVIPRELAASEVRGGGGYPYPNMPASRIVGPPARWQATPMT